MRKILLDVLVGMCSAQAEEKTYFKQSNEVRLISIFLGSFFSMTWSISIAPTSTSTLMLPQLLPWCFQMSLDHAVLSSHTLSLLVELGDKIIMKIGSSWATSLEP